MEHRCRVLARTTGRSHNGRVFQQLLYDFLDAVMGFAVVLMLFVPFAALFALVAYLAK